MPNADLAELKLGPELKRRRITSDYVADAMREAIQSGALPDGAVLNQVAIAERFGVSRVPVREAMKQLQAEGLISAEAHRRAVVRALSVDRILEIYDIRALLEGYLIEKATPNIDDATLRRLESLEAEMRESKDHARWLKLNGRFHAMLYEPSAATMTLELADQLRARAERYVNLWSGGRGIQRNEEAGKEHRRILKHVAKKDVAAARAEVERHIIHTRDRLLELHNKTNGESAA